MRRHDDRGFTLGEVMIVVAIIFVLAAIAVPVLLNQRAKSFDATIRADLRQIASTIEGSELEGSVQRDTNGTVLTIGPQKAADLRLTRGVAWGVRGTTAGFCLTGYHPDSRTFTAERPLTYDSKAGGLGRTGGACTGTVGSDPRPFPVGGGGGMLPEDGATSQPDPWCPTTCAPTAPLGPGGPNLVPNSGLTAAAGNVPRLHAYFSASLARVVEDNPVADRVVRVTSVRDDAGQGVAFIGYQNGEWGDYPAFTTRSEKWSVSAYMKAPAGLPLRIGGRVVDRMTGTYITESACPVVTSTGSWQRLTCVVEVDVLSAANPNSVLGMQANVVRSPVGTIFYVTGPQVEQADTPSVYKPTS